MRLGSRSRTTDSPPSTSAVALRYRASQASAVRFARERRASEVADLPTTSLSMQIALRGKRRIWCGGLGSWKVVALQVVECR